jgi:hypothetical protein
MYVTYPHGTLVAHKRLRLHSGQLERCEEEGPSQLPGLAAVGTLPFYGIASETRPKPGPSG